MQDEEAESLARYIRESLQAALAGDLKGAERAINAMMAEHDGVIAISATLYRRCRFLNSWL